MSENSRALHSHLSGVHDRPNTRSNPSDRRIGDGAMSTASGSNRLSVSPRRRTVSGNRQPASKPFPIPVYLLHSPYSNLFTTSTVMIDPHDDTLDLEDELNVDGSQIHLPTRWNNNDCASLLTIGADGLTIAFAGTGKHTDRDAASVRANFPMPQRHCAIYYWETLIISKGQHGYIGVGFCLKSVNLQRLPGWELGSYGTHCDDGRAFCSRGYGDVFSPTYTTGDTIGCGIDWTSENGRAFYVKNGVFIGYAFENLKGTFYPSVGLRTAGEIVKSNFGSEPFLFDIDAFVRARQGVVFQTIVKQAIPTSALPPTVLSRSSQRGDPTGINGTVQALISSYLMHHGYSATAKSLSDQIEAESHEMRRGIYANSPEKTATEIAAEEAQLAESKKLHKIRHCILSGDAEQALSLAMASYPLTLGVESPDGGLCLKLRIRVFIEKFLAMRIEISKDPQPRGKGKRKVGF